MGQRLSIACRQREWNTRKSRHKYTAKEDNDRIMYAVSSMQGFCPCQEDYHAAILDLGHARSTSFFGVYDGHGGANVAQYCATKLHTELLLDEGYPNDMDNALRRVFSRMDEQLREIDQWRALENYHGSNLEIPKLEGSTACVVLIRGYQIIVANVGDTRCVLSRNGQAIDLSTDHKPNLPDETRRIENAGRRVTKDGILARCAGKAGIPRDCYRVDGLLPMSRAIGDFYFKSTTLPAPQQAVTCIPDIRTEDITHDTEFLLIASGIWDAISSRDAVKFVHEKLEGGMTDLRTICVKLLDRCYVSNNNLTVILVQFRHAARLPHPPPAVQEVHPTGTASSSNPVSSSAGITLDASADAKAEIKEEEDPST